HRADFQYLRNLFAIPAVDQVLALHAGRGGIRVEQRGAFATLAAHAVVGDAVRSFATQFRAQLARHHVVVRVVFGLPTAADVVQRTVHATDIAAHRDTDRGLVRGLEELFSVVYGFLDSRIELVREVQHAVAAVGKTAAFGIDMREGGHQRRRARPTDAVFLRHVRQLAPFFAQARIGQRLDLDSASRSFGSAMASNTPTGGKRLDTIR